MIVIAHFDDKAQTRFADAVFIVAQQRLGNPQRGGHLSLADALFLAQHGQCAGKIRCHNTPPCGLS